MSLNVGCSADYVTEVWWALKKLLWKPHAPAANTPTVCVRVIIVLVNLLRRVAYQSYVKSVL